MKTNFQILKAFQLIFSLFIFSQLSIAQEFKLDNKLRKETVNQIAQNLKEKYVFSDIGEKYANRLMKNLAKGVYNNISNPGDFAEKLTADIKKVQDDKHLSVRFSPKTVIAMREPNLSREENAENERIKYINEKRNNYGFRETKILAGNIGYLRFDEFPSERAAETIISAMRFIQYTDAIIIDLRFNNGGNPEIVAFIASFFFTDDIQTEFSSLYIRTTDKTYQFKTALYIPGKRMENTPLYILVGPETFSAAESFAYDLKHYKRATIVGTKTSGGAHVTKPFIVNDYFVIYIPFARAINPVTNTNWEGTGVIPDIECPADEALQKTQSIITNKLIENNTDKKFLNSFGYSLLREDNIELAIEVFKKNIELHPDYANGYDSLGEAYILNGDNKLAIENYKKALELDPGNDNARKILNELNKK